MCVAAQCRCGLEHTMHVDSRFLTKFKWRSIMSHTIHGAKGLHKQAAIVHKTSDRLDRKIAEHHDRVAVAAYFRAEHRGFNGDQLADWLAAEAEIDAALNKGEDTSVH
jgi:hypothetical protein